MTPSIVSSWLTQFSCLTSSYNLSRVPSVYIYTGSGGVITTPANSQRSMSTEFFRVHKFHQELRARRMEMQPELSLGPVWPALGFASASEKNTKQNSSSSSESDGSSRKRRKHYNAWEEEPVSHPHLELHLNDPLPLDWEQCLDLQSGKMYYLNRKTLKRSWNRPKEQGVNLELNMSTTPTKQAVVADDGNTGATAPATLSQAAATKRGGTAGGNMIAVPCSNCHLLVMMCKSCPTCPNCKFVQSLAPAPATPQAAAHRMLDAAVKPLQTLSLLH
uniref:WW domain-containing protein n=2 Tax=Hordeum vulgare subsp. vulgare TaxID=112509 RepID=A0A8I6XN32_HORVV